MKGKSSTSEDILWYIIQRELDVHIYHIRIQARICYKNDTHVMLGVGMLDHIIYIEYYFIVQINSNWIFVYNII